MKDLFWAIINIFRYAGKAITFLRNTILNLILLAILIGMVIAVLPKKEVSRIPVQAIVRLDISGDIVEEKKLLNSLEKLLGDPVGNETVELETPLQDILDIIENATNDNRTTAMLLNLKNMRHAGLGQLQTIGKALGKFKESGKQVIASEDSYSQSQYYLASYANKIFLNPMGGVDIHGFGVFRLYFRKAMEKLSINYNIFKVGSYKSALEPFIRDDMSPEDRQQNQEWLQALWNLYQSDIMAQRKLKDESLQAYIENSIDTLQNVGGDTAQMALQAGLVDQVASRSEIADYLMTLARSKKNEPQLVGSAEYLATIPQSYVNYVWQGDKVGLIIAEGNILPGKQPQGFIGGDSLAALIKKARDDKQIKALVLRVNTGGGSAFASEIIRQEILLFQKTGRPLVISMGSVAASGGYWIAADADEVWASAATITGSIGIFGAIPTFEKTLDSLGIHTDGIGTTPVASGLDLTQPLPEQTKKALQLSINHSYDRFLDIVADGRDIEKEKVADLAQGRVYDGKTAQAIGLVDKIGSLSEAIESAAKLANTADYVTVYIRPDASLKQQVLQMLTATSSALMTWLGHSGHLWPAKIEDTLWRKFGDYNFLIDPHGIYSHCLLTPTF